MLNGHTAAVFVKFKKKPTKEQLIEKLVQFKGLPQDRQIWFMGDGAPKTRDVIKLPNAHWMDDVLPMAFDMVALAEKSFREKDFLDLAYSVPFYIKDYEAVHGENPLKQLLGC